MKHRLTCSALALLLTMTLWFPVSAENTGSSTLETQATASASFNTEAAQYMNDGVISYGLTDGRWHCWNGESIILTPWVQYDFNTTVKSDTIMIYWYNDGGGVKLPDAVSVQVWKENASDWKNVTVVKDNKSSNLEMVVFDQETFTKIRLLIDNTIINTASGIIEWKVLPSDYRDVSMKAAASASYFFAANNFPYHLNDGYIAYGINDGRWTSYNGENVLLNPWVQYDFESAINADKIALYWYNDGGGVKLPDGVTVQVWKENASGWENVNILSDEKSGGNETITFSPVSFTKMRLVIDNTLVNAAAGLVEWDIFSSPGANPETGDGTAEMITLLLISAIFIKSVSVLIKPLKIEM